MLGDISVGDDIYIVRRYTDMRKIPRILSSLMEFK